VNTFESIKKEKLHLNTFRNNKYQTQICDTVQVLIKKLGGDEVIKVEDLCFTTICTPLPPIPGLRDLADNFAEIGDAVDLLGLCYQGGVMYKWGTRCC